MTSTRNHTRDAEEYFAGERVAAAYAMAEIYAGSKLFILPGVRYEHTTSDYQGNTVLFSGTEEINARAGSVPAPGTARPAPAGSAGRGTGSA